MKGDSAATTGLHAVATTRRLCVIRFRDDNAYNGYNLGDPVKRCQAAVYLNEEIAQSYVEQLNGDPVVESYKSPRSIVKDAILLYGSDKIGRRSVHVVGEIADAVVKCLVDEGVLSDQQVIIKKFDEGDF